MFETRFISGVILIAVLAVLLILGGPFLWLAVLAVSLIGMYELYRLVGIETKLLGIAGYAGAVLYALLQLLGIREVSMAFPIFFLCLLMGIYVLCFPKYTAEEALLAFFGIIYVPVMLFTLYQTRKVFGPYLVWLVIIGSWGCDTCAYCVGMLIGKKRLAPILSPKKSVEGAIGGVAGSALLGLLFGLIFSSHLSIIRHPALGSMLICAAAAVLSQVGDLTASALKRNHNVKDYGNLIPGHGGILDRFDSMIFVAPVIYYLAMVLRA